MTLPWLHISDPDLVNLRKAGRALLLPPAIFFISSLVFRETLIGVFGFLSCFVSVVFADFGGPMPRRAAAYLVSLVLTTLALIVASVLADTTIPAVLATAVLMFAISFATVFGGYMPAFVAPVALAYAFAVFVPLETISLDQRILGWALGGIIATLGALLLWPVNARAKMHAALADATSGLAQALADRAAGGDGSAGLKRATAALAAVRSIAASPLRPAGVASRDVGLLNLFEGLGHAADLAGEVFATTPVPEDKELSELVIAALHRTEATLRGNSPAETITQAIEPLDRCRLERRQQIVSEMATTEADAQAGNPLKRLHASFSVLALSHVALWLEADAAEAMGAGSRIHPVASAPELSAEGGAPSSAFLRLRRIARAEFDPDGVILRNATRSAVAMALGILLAKVAPLGHGFWVALAVLSVLRSSAASTSVTALQAVGGTLVGFLVAALITFALKGDTTVLWWLVAPMAFLAGYAPGAISIAAGQFAFTILVVFLFNILDPDGVMTAVVRLEAVSLGAVTAVVVGLLLWPRGARAALARSVARVYRVAAEGIGVGIAGSDADRQSAAARLEAAVERANGAFAVALGEHGEHVNGAAWSTLARPAAETHALLCGLMPALPAPTPSGCNAAVEVVHRQAAAVSDELGAVADQLESAGESAPPTRSPDQTAALEDCLRASAREGEAGVDKALAILSWNHWLDRLDVAIAETSDARAIVTGAASPRSWLRWSLRPAAK